MDAKLNELNKGISTYKTLLSEVKTDLNQYESYLNNIESLVKFINYTKDHELIDKADQIKIRINEVDFDNTHTDDIIHWLWCINWDLTNLVNRYNFRRSGISAGKYYRYINSSFDCNSKAECYIHPTSITYDNKYTGVSECVTSGVELIFTDSGKYISSGECIYLGHDTDHSFEEISKDEFLSKLEEVYKFVKDYGN